jgi:NitT/TauT family transport system permease protein
MPAKGKALTDSAAAVLVVRVALIGLLLSAWEAAAQTEVLNPMFFGQPTIVAEYMWEYLGDGRLLSSAGVTLQETVLGFVAGVAFGIIIALALWWVPQLGRICERFLVIINAIPKITLAPILIVLFGVGVAMKVALAFLNVFAFVALTAYLGMRRADPDLLDLVRASGGSRWQAFGLVVWPSSYSALIAGMKIGITLSFIGAVVGEYLASRQGLGYLAIYGAEIFNMNLVMLAVICLMAMALLLFSFVQYLERRLLAWKVSA